LFSGDFFSPSTMGSLFEGQQMIKPFLGLNIDVSCLGNHEIDYGIKKAESLLKETKSVWLMSNMFEIDKNMRPLANTKTFHVLEKDGFKIGFLGFAEESWTDLFNP